VDLSLNLVSGTAHASGGESGCTIQVGLTTTSYDIGGVRQEDSITPHLTSHWYLGSSARSRSS
jgi:hypothetical protein